MYYGCPNLSDYFNEKSFTHIDINNFKASVKVIEEAIANNQYEKSVQNIQEAKNLVLDKYNLFAMIAEIAQNDHDLNKQKQLIKLKPENHFPVKKRSLLSKFLKRTKELNKRLWD